MKTLAVQNRASLVRLAVGTMLLLALMVISFTVAPMLAPINEFNPVPVVIFGSASALFGLMAVFTNSWPRHRLGWTVGGSIVMFAFTGVIGTDASRSAGFSSYAAYGWFLGGTCGIIVLLAAAIGLVFPGRDNLRILAADWRSRSF